MKSVAYSMSAVRSATWLKNGDIARTSIMAPGPSFRWLTSSSAYSEKIPLYDTRVDSNESKDLTKHCNVTSTYARRGLPTIGVPQMQIICTQPSLILGSIVNGFSNSHGWSKLLCQNGSELSEYEISPKIEDILNDLLDKEDLCATNIDLLYSTNADTEDKVDITIRNEAIRNLKFIHDIYFGFSMETFAAAVSMIDHFVVKVKVKPKYMGCVVAACYALASEQCEPVENRPSMEDLVSISRCGGSASDLKKMMLIIQSKLKNEIKGNTYLDFLRVFLDERDLPQEVLHLIKISLCSANFHYHRPSCLAIALLTLQSYLLPCEKLISFASFCQVDVTELKECMAFLNQSYEEFYGCPFSSSKDALVWTLSKRTLSNMSSSFPPMLTTIDEDGEC